MSSTVEPFVLWIGLAAAVATLSGGLVVLRLRSALDLLLGFSSGAVVGVALFDLLPEALDLAGQAISPLSITTAVALGFALYRAADGTAEFVGGHRWHFAPASLTAHSLVDGLGIGLAFHVSTEVGMVVALAVLAHDCLDGANTVTLSIAGGSSSSAARIWLILDAAAPVVGMTLARWIVLPRPALALLMGLFAGFFLYIGTSEHLSRHEPGRSPFSTLGAAGAGLAFIYLVVRLAHA